MGSLCVAASRFAQVWRTTVRDGEVLTMTTRVRVSTFVDQDFAKWIDEEAAKEKRSTSAMTWVLLEEARRARRETIVNQEGEAHDE